jgi:hypothetical protein
MDMDDARTVSTGVQKRESQYGEGGQRRGKQILYIEPVVAKGVGMLRSSPVEFGAAAWGGLVAF